MTFDEIFPSGRGDGRKFKTDTLEHKWFEPIFRDIFGYWCGLADSGHYICPCPARHDWSEWPPPKKTKKVILWRGIYRHDDDKHCWIHGDWISSKDKTPPCKYSIVGWESKEVEVEE